MMATYYYPYEVAKVPGADFAVVKATVQVDLRGTLVGLVCCQCNQAWPGCACPETEEQHAEHMEVLLSKFPCVQADRRSFQAFIAAGGDRYSITAFRDWEKDQSQKIALEALGE